MADFYELLERLPNKARDAIDAIIAMDGPTLTDVRRLVRDHKAPEHVVLALFGFLPDAKGKGELVNAYCTTRDLYILDEAHKAAWQLHRMAARPTANIIWSVER